MAIREGKGLFSDNRVWINPKVVRETVESLHVSPEWVQELFAEDENAHYPDDDETHALLSFCFLDRINEDVRSRYLPWADEVIGVKPTPMDRIPHKPEERGTTSPHPARRDAAQSSTAVPKEQRTPEVDAPATHDSDKDETAQLSLPSETTGNQSPSRIPGPSTLFSPEAALLESPPSRVARVGNASLPKGSPSNEACFCGQNPPLNAVMLPCRHRFCLEHLSALRARAGTGSNGNIVCPFCGMCHEHTIIGGYLSVQVDGPVMI